MSPGDDVAAYLAVAARVLRQSEETVLDLVDLNVLDHVLTEAEAAATASRKETFQNPMRASLHRQAAVLLIGLVRQRPLARDNDAVAVAATLQMLASKGLTVDLGPPQEAAAFIARIASGEEGPDDVAAWLARARLVYSFPDLWPDLLTRRWAVDRVRVRRLRPKIGTFERFTGEARRAIVLAEQEARRLGHRHITTEHLLLGLVGAPEFVAARVLESLSVPAESVRRQVEDVLGPPDPPAGDPLPFTAQTKKVLELSLREALRLGHGYIGTEHILLALAAEGGTPAALLLDLGVEPVAMKDSVTWHSSEALSLAVPGPGALAARRSEVLQQVEDVFDDNERLRAENERLKELLRRHGIEPGTAQAG